MTLIYALLDQCQLIRNTLLKVLRLFHQPVMRCSSAFLRTFKERRVSYYCVVHTQHVEQFEVRNRAVHLEKITDSDSDGT